MSSSSGVLWRSKEVYKALARHPDLSVDVTVGDMKRITVKVWLVRAATYIYMVTLEIKSLKKKILDLPGGCNLSWLFGRENGSKTYILERSEGRSKPVSSPGLSLHYCSYLACM